MGIRIQKTTALESLVLVLVPPGVNLCFPLDPGFLHWAGLPYLAPGILVAGFYGIPWGLVQLVLGIVSGFWLVPWLFHLWQWGTPVFDPPTLGTSGFLALSALLVLGFVHNRRQVLKRRLLDRLKRSVRKIATLQRKASGLLRINTVLEERVVNQVDSISLLRNQVKKLGSLNLAQALETLLETVTLFTEMTSGSIYVLNPETRTLVAAATRGWDDSIDVPWELSLESSVVGYVFRNGKPFSIRMMLNGHEFSGFHPETNLLTYPIRVKGRVWGVLNIEKLPFERYSSHTESILEIILSLIEPYLAEILEYEIIFRMNENDPVTGLPLLTQMYQSLDQELGRLDREEIPVSLVLFEIVNFEELERTSTRSECKKLLLRIKQGLDEAHETKYRAFHFKNENQLALLVTGLDQDGTSFFSLDLLALVPRLRLTLEDKPVNLEVIVGFATAHDATMSSEVLVGVAENLLNLQRF